MASNSALGGSVLLWCCISFLLWGKRVNLVALEILLHWPGEKKTFFYVYTSYVFYNIEQWQKRRPGQMWPPGEPDVWERQYCEPCDRSLPHQREKEKERNEETTSVFTQNNQHQHCKQLSKACRGILRPANLDILCLSFNTDWM